MVFSTLNNAQPPRHNCFNQVTPLRTAYEYTQNSVSTTP